MDNNRDNNNETNLVFFLNLNLSKKVKHFNFVMHFHVEQHIFYKF